MTRTGGGPGKNDECVEVGWSNQIKWGWESSEKKRRNLISAVIILQSRRGQWRLDTLNASFLGTFFHLCSTATLQSSCTIYIDMTQCIRGAMICPISISTKNSPATILKLLCACDSLCESDKNAARLFHFVESKVGTRVDIQRAYSSVLNMNMKLHWHSMKDICAFVHSCIVN